MGAASDIYTFFHNHHRLRFSFEFGVSESEMKKNMRKIFSKLRWENPCLNCNLHLFDVYFSKLFFLSSNIHKIYCTHNNRKLNGNVCFPCSIDIENLVVDSIEIYIFFKAIIDVCCREREEENWRRIFNWNFCYDRCQTICAIIIIISKFISSIFPVSCLTYSFATDRSQL